MCNSTVWYGTCRGPLFWNNKFELNLTRSVSYIIIDSNKLRLHEIRVGVELICFWIAVFVFPKKKMRIISVIYITSWMMQVQKSDCFMTKMMKPSSKTLPVLHATATSSSRRDVRNLIDWANTNEIQCVSYTSHDIIFLSRVLYSM